MRRVWLLNFDADEELAQNGPSSRSKVTPRDLAERLTRAVAALVGTDELFDPFDPRPVSPYTPDAVGFTFMPTPAAERAFAERGVRMKRGPSLSVLRRANDRALSASLGVALPGATYVTTPEDARAALLRPSVTGTWLLKRSFGFAGRGSKRVTHGEPTDDVRSFVRNSLSRGGLEVTPWVDRSADFGLHGFLSESGLCEVGAPTIQHCDRFGQWERTARATIGATAELSEAEAQRLTQAIREAAEALRAVGYFGPFGIDGFRYTLPDGSTHFCPRCEINARYTMGWAIGMGDLRPDLAPTE